MASGTTLPAQPEAAPLREPASIWFPASLAVAARRAATSDGVPLGEWVTGMVEREVRRRNGRCPACGAERTAT